MPSAIPSSVMASVASRVASSVISVSRSLASPKSSTFTRPSSLTMMLPGLTSRWTMPLSCAAASASAMGMARSNNRSSSNPRLGIRVARVWPSTSSMVRKWTAGTVAGRSVWSRSACSTEKMVTMLGWLRAATARASRLKRSRRSGSEAIFAGSTLSATLRRSSVSSAR